MATWVRGVIHEVRLNFTPGMVAWALHRITGVLLVCYLFAHIILLGAALKGAAAFDSAMAGLRTPFFTFLESAIVVVVAYHMFNGLRIIAVEFGSLTRRQQKIFWLVITGSITTMACTGWVFVERALG